MDRFDKVSEFSLTCQDITDIDRMTYELGELARAPGTQEHELFDNVDKYSRAGRSRFPELSEALDALVSGEGDPAVAIQLPPDTSEAYGPTPAQLPVDKALFPGDIYPALFTSMAGGGAMNHLWAFGILRYNVIQTNVLVPHENGVIPDDGRKKNADPNADLELHIDGLRINLNQGEGPDPGEPNRNCSPDFVTLHYIRNPEQAHLKVAAPEVDKLSERTRALLRQPILPLMGPEHEIRHVPLLFGPENRPRIRYNHRQFADHPRIPNADARMALREFDAHLQERTRYIAAYAGTIVILRNNGDILHGRDPYTPLLNGGGRWMRRICYSADEERMQKFLADGIPKERRILDISLVRAASSVLNRR